MAVVSAIFVRTPASSLAHLPARSSAAASDIQLQQCVTARLFIRIPRGPLLLHLFFRMPDFRRRPGLFGFQFAQFLGRFFVFGLCPFQAGFRPVRFGEIALRVGMIGGAAQRARPAVLQPPPFLLKVADPAEESNLPFEGFDLLFQSRLLIRKGFDLTRAASPGRPEKPSILFSDLPASHRLFRSGR